MKGEIDRHLIAGVSKFLDNKTREYAISRQKRCWQFDPHEREDVLKQYRAALRYAIGIRDARAEDVAMELLATTDQSAVVASCIQFEVLAVRWRAFGDVYAEGLMLRPRSRVLGQVVVIPDPSQTPEQLAGLADGVPEPSRVATFLASNGCQVLIPTIVSREQNQFAWSGRRADVTNREFLYRSAFEMGRHIIGYEVNKVLAGIDWFESQDTEVPIGVVGWGDGAMLGLFAAALDERIDVTCLSGFFEPMELDSQKPVDRNVFGLIERFGAAELASMVAPRSLVVETCQGPELVLSGGAGAPGVIKSPDVNDARNEFARARQLAKSQGASTKKWQHIESGEKGDGPSFYSVTRQKLIELLPQRNSVTGLARSKPLELVDAREGFDPNTRLLRQMQQIDRHTQNVLRKSVTTRKDYMTGLPTDSLAAHEKKLPEYRRKFANVIGHFDDPLLPVNARTRKVYDEEKWVGYQVVLDVFPDVIAYGLLLLPKDLKEGERRPVVVCQHGLEGRPQDVIGKESHHYYKAFAAKLAERGFITFAPQNLYRHGDDFRVLQRKANPIGKTLFSIITPQHQQIINWLKTQPNVDGDRIGFYGLSYGGKTAMRVPALLPDYCLSICSADFNEWVDKNASTLNPRSYAFMGEYEIFEFDLGTTFNYAEMAALIAPRPFMVERGHDDGVADDETVAYEFAKVRRRYTKLGVADRCEIEWFDGPHTINGKGTFDFLHRHLNWPSVP